MLTRVCMCVHAFIPARVCVWLQHDVVFMAALADCVVRLCVWLWLCGHSKDLLHDVVSMAAQDGSCPCVWWGYIARAANSVWLLL